MVLFLALAASFWIIAAPEGSEPAPSGYAIRESFRLFVDRNVRPLNGNIRTIIGCMTYTWIRWKKSPRVSVSTLTWSCASGIIQLTEPSAHIVKELV